MQSLDKSIIRIFLTVLTALGLSACYGDYAVPSIQSDIPESGSPFTRALQQDALTMQDFRRCYGVGFSYDGVWGQRCNLRDVHCRVFDFDAVKRKSQEVHERLYRFSSNNQVTFECNTAFSHSQYRQYSSFDADVEAKLILFNGDAQSHVEIWEEGQTNDFFCEFKYIAPAMSMQLEDGSISVLIKDGDGQDMLTPNFLEAIRWMEKHSDEATIDSFLICYGSHVVTRANLGGSIILEMTMKRDSLHDVYSKKSIGNAVSSIFKHMSQSEEYTTEYNLLNSADCYVKVKGGDLSTIPNEILHFRFGEAPDMSQYVTGWQNSLNYDPEDYAHNNLEMTDMEITPIWDFIPNKEIAKRVMLRVEGTAKDLIYEGGYQNYCNTSFSLPQKVECKMGGSKVSFNQPDVCNIISSGRYVATVCRETIEIPYVGQKQVQVVYPIYDQHVNLSCGFTFYGDTAYNVCWLKNRCMVYKDTQNPVPTDGMIYMTNGIPGTICFSNIRYQPSQTVIGYEWPLAITQEGTLDTGKPYFLTYKKGKDFYLKQKNGTDQSGRLEGLPGWSYSNGRMVRKKESEYFYYWNPTEVSL